MKNKFDRRYRSWAFILYPESAVSDWYEKLDDVHVPIAISPLHDLDYDENHQKKKPHYHVIIAFDGKKSFDQVKVITDSVCGTIPQAINCLYSYYRYLCHLDQPHKVHYDVNGIILLSGFDPKNYISEQVGVFVSEMVEFIQEQNITEFSDFVEYCQKEHLNDWFSIITDYKSNFFRDYLYARKHRGRK